MQLNFHKPEDKFLNRL